MTDFDVRDRLEILDLLHRYSHCWDGHDFAGFCDLFVAEPTVVAKLRGEEQGRLEGRAGLVSLNARNEAFREAGVQRRHLMTNVIVDDQTEAFARVAAYVGLFSTSSDGDLTTVTTVRYSGEVIRSSEGWRIQLWEIDLDRAA